MMLCISASNLSITYPVDLMAMPNRSLVRIMLMVAYGMDIKKDAKEV